MYLVDYQDGQYTPILMEEGVAPSNARGFVYQGRSYVIAAARDMDQVILYELTQA